MNRIMLALLLAITVQAAEQKFGKPLALKETLALKVLAANPEPYVGKQLRVEGKITEVCQAMGCWMMLTDSENHMMRIKVNDGEIAFPKDAAGRRAIAEGTLAKFELSHEEAIEIAKHEAQEMGRPFNPKSVKPGPLVIYQIQGTGAVLF